MEEGVGEAESVVLTVAGVEGVVVRVASACCGVAVGRRDVWVEALAAAVVEA